MADRKRVALVTGANKGIGFEIARQLGAQGMAVLVAARDRGRGDEATARLQAEGLDATVVPLDVTDQVTIDRAAAFVDQTYGVLDVLVNNAGISLKEGRLPPSQLDLGVFKQVFDTNVFGAFAVTKAMLPLLRRSDAGRIVNVSSTLGSLARSGQMAGRMPPLLAYNASKTALNALTVYFAQELQGTSIKVNSVSPGFVATDLNDHRGYLTTEQGARVPVFYATLPADGPTGGFFDENGSVPW